MHLADTYPRGNKQTNNHNKKCLHLYIQRLAIEETNKHLHACISRQLYPIEESNKQTNTLFYIYTFNRHDYPKRLTIKETNKPTNKYIYLYKEDTFIQSDL